MQGRSDGVRKRLKRKSLKDWQHERAALLQRVEKLRRAGTCYICRDLQTGEVFADEHILYEDDRFRAVLDPFPRVKGHTILVYKPHREDLSEVAEAETGPILEMVVVLTNALKEGLGAERVYVLSQCDGPVTHLNFHLLPRFKGMPIGRAHLARERHPLENGAKIASRIRRALGVAQATESEREES